MRKFVRLLQQRVAPSVIFTTDQIHFTVEEMVDHSDHSSKGKIFNITTVFFLRYAIPIFLPATN